MEAYAKRLAPGQNHNGCVRLELWDYNLTEWKRILYYSFKALMKNLMLPPFNRRAVHSLKLCFSCKQATLSFVLVIAANAAVSAAEITALRDAQGHCVYVTVEDQKLRAAVRRGGVAAAMREIDHRRLALPGIDQFIEQASLENRLDPRLVKAIIQVESAWNARARSHKGALGLMQLMPETARRFGVRDPFDPRDNIRGGTRYLRFLLDRFQENLQYSLAAYNAGERVVDTWRDVPPYVETRAYLERINMIYAAREQEAGLGANAIARIAEGNRLIYTNVD